MCSVVENDRSKKNDYRLCLFAVVLCAVEIKKCVCRSI
jgi:hypothetical protein